MFSSYYADFIVCCVTHLGCKFRKFFRNPQNSHGLFTHAPPGPKRKRQSGTTGPRGAGPFAPGPAFSGDRPCRNKYYDRKNKYYDRKSCRCDRKNGDYTCFPCRDRKGTHRRHTRKDGLWELTIDS